MLPSRGQLSARGAVSEGGCSPWRSSLPSCVLQAQSCQGAAIPLRTVKKSPRQTPACPRKAGKGPLSVFPPRNSGLHLSSVKFDSIWRLKTSPEQPFLCPSSAAHSTANSVFTAGVFTSPKQGLCGSPQASGNESLTSWAARCCNLRGEEIGSL